MSITHQEYYDTRVPTLIIQPTRGWGRLALHEVWEYRDLLYFLLWRDVKGRYRQMALGPLWIVLRPLFNMVLFTLIFGMVAKLPSDGIPYPLFTYSALLPWILRKEFIVRLETYLQESVLGGRLKQWSIK